MNKEGEGYKETDSLLQNMDTKSDEREEVNEKINNEDKHEETQIEENKR